MPRKSIEDFGYTVEQVARMARVGFLFKGVEESIGDGQVTEVVSFCFLPNTPMGRINVEKKKKNTDLLDRAIEDARTMETGDFAAKYSGFGPYESTE